MPYKNPEDQKAYVERNRERINERNRKRYRERYATDPEFREQQRLKKKKWHKENPDKAAAYNRERKFGITQEEYEEMLDRQNGVCAICGGVNANGRRLSVDHNHDTDEIRDLLCGPCNTALGQVGESVDTLESMIEYIRRWNQDEPTTP